MNKETLKVLHKRSNISEQKVLETVIDNVPNLVIFGKDNTKAIVQKRLELTIGKNRLFINAETTNKTEYGHNTKIEFLLITATNKWLWFDAKHLTKEGNRIANTLLYEIELAKACKGLFYFICFGAGYTDNKIKFFRKEIKQRQAVNVNITKDLLPVLCNI